jgi:hypothetical protein
LANQSDSLESIFNDVAPQAEPAASAAEPAPSAPSPSGESAQAQAPEPSATPAPKSDEDAVEVVIRSGGKAVPLEAVLTERRKRQERQATLERELAEARGQLSVYSQAKRPEAPPDPAEQKPGYWDDPEKYTEAKLSEVERRNEERLLRMSAAQMRNAHPDYDSVAQAFAEAAQANPMLEQACLRSDNPALYAYQNGKTYLEAKKYGGSIDNMREAIRKEEEAKAEAKFRKQGALDAAAQASTSTAGARSVGNAPTFTGPVSLSELFPGAL